MTRIQVYVRHRRVCPEISESFRKCDCPKWLRYSGDFCACGHAHKGRQHRLSAETRTWGLAEEKAFELQKRLDGGSGSGGGDGVTQTQTAPVRIADELKTYLSGKASGNCGRSTLSKLTFQLGVFEQFMAGRAKFYPSDVTKHDLIEYRATWVERRASGRLKGWESGIVRQKVQSNLRGFLKFCGIDFSALSKIIVSKEDKNRTAPRPFSESELKRILAQVPKVYPDPEKTARLTALIHLQVSTGLAITDAVRLQKGDIIDGYLRIKRQKTNKEVNQRLDPALYQELLAVTNGNPRYIFWNGTSQPETATTIFQRCLLQVMKAAGVYVSGNTTHRFRDTAADYWLSQGCSMTKVASLLGDTTAVAEKHYSDLASKRMQESLADVPVRSWSES